MSGSGPGSVSVSPVLLQKGNTRVALYGMGYLRDARLYQMLHTPGQVTWKRPAEEEDGWFNIFFIHQNRAARAAKNSVSEGMLPGWLDFVVWGHEHACKVDPAASAEGAGNFVVSQPGSSVQTTLSEDEAIPKKILFLEISGPRFRSSSVPLTSVRPFVFRNLALRDHDELKGKETDAESVRSFLADQVTSAIGQAQAEAIAGSKGATKLPLVRLRVDHGGGFPTVSLQAFGRAFTGKVANPGDLLQFHKPIKRAPKREGTFAGEDGAAGGVEPTGDGAIPTEQSDYVRIGQLVAEHLPTSLEVLTEGDMAAALEQFVQQDEKHALEQAVKRALAESQRVLSDMGEKGGGAAPDALHFSAAELRAAKAEARAAKAGAKKGGDAGAGPSSPPKAKAKAGKTIGEMFAAAPAAAKGKAKAAPAAPAEAPAPRARRAAAAKKTSYVDEVRPRVLSGCAAADLRKLTLPHRTTTTALLAGRKTRTTTMTRRLPETHRGAASARRPSRRRRRRMQRRTGWSLRRMPLLHPRKPRAPPPLPSPRASPRRRPRRRRRPRSWWSSTGACS